MKLNEGQNPASPKVKLNLTKKERQHKKLYAAWMHKVKACKRKTEAQKENLEYKAPINSFKPFQTAKGFFKSQQALESKYKVLKARNNKFMEEYAGEKVRNKWIGQMLAEHKDLARQYPKLPNLFDLKFNLFAPIENCERGAISARSETCGCKKFVFKRDIEGKLKRLEEGNTFKRRNRSQRVMITTISAYEKQRPGKYDGKGKI